MQYEFEGEVIKLKEKDYKKWEKAFPHCDLDIELMLLDGFWQNEKEEGRDIRKWFYVSMCKLRYRNDQLKEQQKRERANQSLREGSTMDRMLDTSWADHMIDDNVVKIGERR